ncbi:MAG TPA: kelch repeat-containing protein [Anaerolineae bacterium]|nr:kelch repeat-containing protein [Anaerolineae bacterium]
MADPTMPLSDRELELVELLATGASNAEIARDLHISVNTVKVHLRNIYTKLEVASRTEATMLAVREGWIAVPRVEGEGETREAPAAPPVVARPEHRALQPAAERWPRVPLLKRAVLVLAILLALPGLFLPQILEGAASGTNGDPIFSVFPTAANGASPSRWHTRAQMPTPRTHLAVAVHNGLVYAMGGVSSDGVSARVEVYDPVADVWQVSGAKPAPVGFVSAAVIGDRIYLPGGFDATEPQRILEIYDPGSGTWQTGAPLPVPLGAYGLAVHDDMLYLIGGRGRADEYVNTLYRYDPTADEWQSLAPMPTTRGFLGAVALDGRIYAVGGYDGEAELNTCEVYDPAADAWSACAPLRMRRGGLGLAAVRSQLYAVGGGMDEGSFLTYNESYDPRIDMWQRIETPVTEQWRGVGLAFVYPYLYAIGGWSDGFLSTNEAYQALFQQILP